MRFRIVVAIAAALTAPIVVAQTGTVTTAQATGTAGVHIHATTTGAPDVAARLGASTSASGFRVFNAANAELFRIDGLGRAALRTTTPRGSLTVAGEGAEARIVLSGNEFYQSANTSTEGVAFILGVNRLNNRQLWIGDSGNMTPSTTYSLLRIYPTVAGFVDLSALATDGATPKTLGLNIHGGNVGVGLSAPTEKLHVQGNLRVTGTITGGSVIGAKYQDIAEWVSATGEMMPGTVVVLNLQKANEVVPSARSYDTAVAGVISAQPGIILGIEDPGKEQVATTGRVKVRVDARNTPIRIGDLLVTSAMPGRAMRSEPVEIDGHSFHKPGTIIGKALEPLANGVGEILVLLSMQ
jgi:hypothetical protein